MTMQALLNDHHVCLITVWILSSFDRSDTRLFKDDHDIRFSKILNSCKVPQIRYASLERLLERLTDLRFLSIDFLNTFLLTFRVFTDWETIVSTLERVYRNPDTVEGQLK